MPAVVGQVTLGIDLQLDIGGTIEGTVVDDWLGEPIVSHLVAFWDENGTRIGAVDEVTTLETGSYKRRGLPAGTCFVTTAGENAYQDELYDDLPCEPSCDPTAGTAVQVDLGQNVSAIDFQLEQSWGIRGAVVRGYLGVGLCRALTRETPPHRARASGWEPVGR